MAEDGQLFATGENGKPKESNSENTSLHPRQIDVHITQGGPRPSSLAPRRIFVERTPAVDQFLRVYAVAFSKTEDKDPAVSKALQSCSPEIDLDLFYRCAERYHQRMGTSKDTDLGLVLQGARITRREYLDEEWNRLSELEKMRREGEERRYVMNIKRTMPNLGKMYRASDQDTFADSLKSLGMGINLLMGLFLSFLAGYYVLKHLEMFSETVCLLVGATCCFAFLIMESLLMIFYDYKLTRRRLQQERKHKARACEDRHASSSLSDNKHSAGTLTASPTTQENQPLDTPNSHSELRQRRGNVQNVIEEQYQATATHHTKKA